MGPYAGALRFRVLKGEKVKRPHKPPARLDRDFIQTFQRLADRYSSWCVWQDFIFMSAAAIANKYDKRPGVWRKREDEYNAIQNRYTLPEWKAMADMLAFTISALKENPAQDFLGELFMRLDLGNHWKGQFFTPYHISELMALVTAGSDLKERIGQRGYISMNDPTCGAGCMLVAFANVCSKQGVDYRNSVIFVGQDVDPIAAKMCYIQMATLDMAGYVVIGNTLTEAI